MMMPSHLPIPADVERIGAECVDCGLTIHRHLGPGFRERIYHQAFLLELDARGIPFEAQKAIGVRYKSWVIPGQRVDLLVAGVVVIEIKAVPRLASIHSLQLLSYLKTMDLRLGLVMNFNGRLFKDGVRRVVL